MSFERSVGRRLVIVAALGLFASALTGCQVRPLHSGDGAIGSALASISISPAKDRVEQGVRNHLVFLFGAGAGEPASARYDLALAVRSETFGVLLEQSSDVPSAGRVVVSADYVLRDTASGDVLRAGRRSAVALVDFSEQEFAKRRALRDAEDRGARELAEFIRADIAAALGR